MLRTMVYKRKEHATLQERHMRDIYTKPTLTELHSKQRLSRLASDRRHFHGGSGEEGRCKLLIGPACLEAFRRRRHCRGEEGWWTRCASTSEQSTSAHPVHLGAGEQWLFTLHGL